LLGPQTLGTLSANTCYSVRGQFGHLQLCSRTFATLSADTCCSVRGRLHLCQPALAALSADACYSVRGQSSKCPRTEQQVCVDRVATVRIVRGLSSKCLWILVALSTALATLSAENCCSVRGCLLLCSRTVGTLSADTSGTCNSVFGRLLLNSRTFATLFAVGPVGVCGQSSKCPWTE
jgi:hypothetical protein